MMHVAGKQFHILFTIPYLFLRATPPDGVNFIPYIKLLGVE
jgi:hypothetical protein